MTTGADIAATARDWLGVPFRHQGRSRRGIDCAGLVVVVAAAHGLDKVCGYTGGTAYGVEPTTDHMRRTFQQYLLRTDNLEEGCILHFGMAKLPQHCAIYTQGSMIHAYNSGRRVVVENGYSGKWAKYLHGIYRYKGLEA